MKGSQRLLIVLALLTGCAPAADHPQLTLREAALTSAGSTTTCDAQRYLLELSDPAASCPAANPSWSVSQQRIAAKESDPPLDAGTEVALLSARCTYRWIGAGEPPDGALPNDAPGLERLCLEEPPLPDALRSFVCPEDRQIGHRQAGRSCERVDSWDSEPLFPEHRGDGDALADYCIYTHAGGPEAARLAAPLPGWADASPDCFAVGTQAGAGERAELEQAFLDAAEWVPHMPLLADGGTPTPVEVAVIDTALDPRPGDGLPGRGAVAHGRAMGMLIRQLACPDDGVGGACLVDVRSWLALRFDRTPTGFVRNAAGGPVGSQADLAKAIVAAVDGALPGRHTALNLSIGWSKTWGGGEATANEFAAPVHAAYDALSYARCRDKLAIAAAGNTRGRPPLPLGPLFPAAWTTHPAPTRAECARLGVTRTDAPGPGPLLWAAGPVDFKDRPLPNTPIDGRPPLAAPGWYMVVDDPAPAAFKPGAPLTGSSNASAVSSAGAATLWAYHDELTPDQVMAELYVSGIDLGRPADFCPEGPPCPNLHRVSLCAALQAACSPDVVAQAPSPRAGVALQVAAPTSRCQAFTCTTDGSARSLPEEWADPALSRGQPCAYPAHHPGCAPSSPPAGASLDVWGVPALGPFPPEPPCRGCELRVGLRDVNFIANPANATTFGLEGVWLSDTLGGLWVWGNPSALRLGTGNATWALGGLGLMAPPVYVAEADFSYTESGPWGAYLVVLTQPLQVLP